MDNRERCRIILDRLEGEYPDASTLLKYRNLFELLVAVILSAQSTDEQVNRVTDRLFARYPTPYALAEASLEELEEIIKKVGLYKSKARNLKKMAEMLIARYNGEVPDNMEELLALPGVGRKTANVVLSVGFNKPGLGVDTHVHRVANRLGLVKAKNPKDTEKQLKELIAVSWWGKAHHLFIFHGRRVCKARRPYCTNCLIEDLCLKIF
ncbi:DNA-(apurinic or apyrimidinic site) lyase /endonuclease III [Thermosyntropha lipolytica DSM 11003]|uniref:Endonuclease III n=1 Tax=Thermosyntropha lipolytica DSM 11003 TaxID=1123382 RepID=A0A1M5K9Y8_9FIRM|nr:endonuclease III [Thermosyntropha lipolytica]SHG49410.1 DNA-(apurinic or apyrimidinic site) lyase /endonuclease III [Thermosyntropha lipolytica DSM 11003]